MDVGQSVFAENIPYGVKSIDYATPSGFDTYLDYVTRISEIYANFAGAGGGGSISDYYSSLPM